MADRHLRTCSPPPGSVSFYIYYYIICTVLNIKCIYIDGVQYGIGILQYILYICDNINCLIEYLKSILLATSKCMLLLILPVYNRSQKNPYFPFLPGTLCTLNKVLSLPVCLNLVLGFLQSPSLSTWNLC